MNRWNMSPNVGVYKIWNIHMFDIRFLPNYFLSYFLCVWHCTMSQRVSGCCHSVITACTLLHSASQPFWSDAVLGGPHPIWVSRWLDEVGGLQGVIGERRRFSTPVYVEITVVVVVFLILIFIEYIVGFINSFYLSSIPKVVIRNDPEKTSQEN